MIVIVKVFGHSNSTSPLTYKCRARCSQLFKHPCFWFSFLFQIPRTVLHSVNEGHSFLVIFSIVFLRLYIERFQSDFNAPNKALLTQCAMMTWWGLIASLSCGGREGYKVASQHDRARHVKRGWVGLGPIGGGYKLTRTTFRPRPYIPTSSSWLHPFLRCQTKFMFFLGLRTGLLGANNSFKICSYLWGRKILR